MKNDKWKNDRRSPVRLPVVIFLIFILATLNSPDLFGARVAGEEGVSPSTSQERVIGQGRPKTVAPRQPARPKVKPKPPKKRVARKTEVSGKKRDARFVNIDFDNVDIALFIKFVSELTGKNFVVGNKVRGKVTIISPKKISVNEAYKVFESVLEVHGFTTVPSGNVIKIVPIHDARSKSIETRLKEERMTPEDKVVTQLVPLEYANPEELKKLFAPMISKNSLIISYSPTRVLIVTDVLSNIQRILKIVKAIDVIGVGEEITVIPVKHADVSNLAKSLNTVFAAGRAKTKKARGMAVKIVPDERTNVLITLATEETTIKIKQLIELLDKETPPGERDVHVYYLQNANAEDLAKVLMNLPAKQAKALVKGKAPLISREVQIVADKATNTLVITAGKDDFHVLEDVIKKLDISRPMVYIEALIMEVKADKKFELGVQWHAVDHVGSHEGRKIGAFGGAALGESIYPTVDTATGVGSLPSGFSLGVLGDKISIGGVDFLSIGAVLRAYQTDSDVHILSRPQILTMDNEEAEIKVGENVPYPTTTGTTTAGRDYETYEYKDVGITLKITPQINRERFVRLTIFQEISKVTEWIEGSRPRTLKRSAKTTVTVKDKNMIVIGGLIGEDITRVSYKVPCLGDIPCLGWFFKSVSRTRGKTNLFIFLMPHIIENQSEAKAIYEEKKEQIDKIVEESSIKLYKKKKNSDE